MLYYPFENKEKFEEMFGIVEHGNGNKSRKNKILLSYFKTPAILKKAVAGDTEILNIHSMQELKQYVIRQMTENHDELKNSVRLINYRFYSNAYKTDDLTGACEDGDIQCVRYIKNGHPYKMKAGKFFKHIIEETSLGKMLPPQVITYLCEEFSLEWQAYSSNVNPTTNNLYVNDNFSDIYDSDMLNGDFKSCMVDKGFSDFYSDYCPNAKAAYLKDEYGLVIARCIIFLATDEESEDGKQYRLAERQYSTDFNDGLKRTLIDA